MSLELLCRGPSSTESTERMVVSSLSGVLGNPLYGTAVVGQISRRWIVMPMELSERQSGAILFPSSDHFPLGRPYGRVDMAPEPASPARPFGLMLAVPLRTTVRLNPGDLVYDEEEQVGLIRTGDGLVRMDRHTDGQTNTRTNNDGHGGLDSDTDWREG